MMAETPFDEFFEQETIQRIIDYQFIQTSQLVNRALWTYLIGFVFPFAITIGLQSGSVWMGCYIVCLLT